MADFGSLVTGNDPAMWDEWLKKIASQMTQEPDRKAPLSTGLMAAGLGMLANAHKGFAGAAGEGGLLGLNTWQQALAAQKKDPMQQLQMINAIGGIQERQQNQRKQLAREGAYQAITRDMNRPQTVAGDYGPGEAPTAPKPANTTYQYFKSLADALQEKGLMEDSVSAREKAEKYAPKLKDQKVYTDPTTGQRTVFNVYEDGRMEPQVGAGPDKEKLSFQDFGGSVAGLDPYSGAPKTQYKKDPTPGDAMTDARSREQFGITDQRQREQMAQTWGIAAANREQADRHFNANLSQPQVTDTGGGIVLVDRQSGKARPVVGEDGQPVEKSKEMPAQYTKQFVENEQILNRIDTAATLASGRDIGKLKGDARATGPIMGSAPDTLNIVDPKGVATRAAIADLGTLQLFLRSGAAVTLSEWERAKPYIPKITDTPNNVRVKLDYLRKIIKDENDALSANAKAMGYRTKSGGKDDPFGLRSSQDDPLGLR